MIILKLNIPNATQRFNFLAHITSKQLHLKGVVCLEFGSAVILSFSGEFSNDIFYRDDKHIECNLPIIEINRNGVTEQPLNDGDRLELEMHRLRVSGGV